MVLTRYVAASSHTLTMYTYEWVGIRWCTCMAWRDGRRGDRARLVHPPRRIRSERETDDGSVVDTRSDFEPRDRYGLVRADQPRRTRVWVDSTWMVGGGAAVAASARIGGGGGGGGGRGRTHRQRERGYRGSRTKTFRMRMATKMKKKKAATPMTEAAPATKAASRKRKKATGSAAVPAPGSATASSAAASSSHSENAYRARMRHLQRAALTQLHHRDPAVRPRAVLPRLSGPMDDCQTLPHVPGVPGEDPELRPNLPLVRGDS